MGIFLSAVGLCVVMVALIVVFAGIAFALGKVLPFKAPPAVMLGVVNTLAVGIVLAWGVRSSEAGWREVLPGTSGDSAAAISSRVQSRTAEARAAGCRVVRSRSIC